MRGALPALSLLAASLFIAPPAQAQWSFGPAVDLAGGPAAFPHLDAAGRQAIAVSAGRVAVVWEDSRAALPRCHVALRPAGATGFREFAIGAEDCFAPAITPLDNGRFGVIWEDEGGLSATLVDATGARAARKLAGKGSHGSLVWHPRLGLHAAWSAVDGHRQRIWRSRLTLSDAGLGVGTVAPADPVPPVDDQLHPVLAATTAAISLAWEDRRHGHTVIHASTSRDGAAWTPPQRVSRNPTGKAPGTDLGRGSGAMQPALAAFAAGRLAAVWLDKRDFLSGYDVYAALSDDGGIRFGNNLKAQDSFGDAIAQWHVAAAGNRRGDLAIAWDDERDGGADIWLTWLQADGGFADNVSPSPAAGPGSQTDPAIALDEAGNLHLAWIERDNSGAARLRYSLGTPANRPSKP